MPESADTTTTPAELGTQAEPLAERPRARERGRMRRRLRSQKRIREALLLDLGALVYELHRQGRREPELLQAKAAELTAVDQEVRGLADALEADAGILAVVATGVAGTCESCGSLLSTDSRYCSACGNPAVPAASVRGRTEAKLPEAPAHAAVGAAPAGSDSDSPAPEVASVEDEDPAIADERAEQPAPWAAEQPAPWLSHSDAEAGREGPPRDG